MRRALATLVIASGLGLTIVPQAEALKITELLAVNDTILADEDGDFSDWLEIFNDGAMSVDLGGWYLTDDAADLTKWQFPTTVLAPGGYLVVFCSDKDRAVSGQELHTSFKLSSGGEYTALVHPDGSTVEHEYAPAFPEQTADVSYGLATDLATERCFLSPTPGAANDDSVGCGPIAPLVFSLERGFYDAPISVEITTATAGVTIRYTTDGSTPSETAGTVYGGPVAITTTTPLRAYAYGVGFSSSPVATQTYIYLDDVILQNKADVVPPYPDKWTGGVHADYDMDPEVVFDPAYSAEIVDDLKSIPTMSIVTDRDNLFASDIGIYTHVSRRGMEWERPISMEIIYGDGRQGTQENAGIRIQGEYSRSTNNKKHSFRLAFRGIYGADVLDWPLFPTSEVDEIDQFILTGRHGNSWHNGWSTAQYIRDTFCKDTQAEMGQLAPHSAYVHLYLNGIYWGMYRATERPSAGFLAAHLGGSKDDYDALNAGEAVDGDRVAWEAAQSLANAGVETLAAYQQIQGLVDLSSLIDFFIINQYGNNTDWDSKNWYAGRERAPGAGFRFFCWDAEQTMASPFGNRIGMGNYDSPSSIYTSLRKDSAEFRLLFGDHVHRHFFNDGAMTPARVIERWLRRADEIYGAIVGESARWGDKARTQPYTRDKEWIVEQKRLVYAYFSKRTGIAIDQYRKAKLYPEVDAPSFSQHGGDIEAGFELEISAPAGTIYYTLDGTDPRVPGGTVSAAALTYAGPVTLTGTTTVKARALVGSEWSALDEARFMLESPIRVTELSFNPAGDDGAEFIEVANTGSSPVDLSGYAFTDGIDFVFPSLMVAPGEHVVAVRDAVAFTTAYGVGPTVAGQYTGALANEGERIELRDAAGNVIHDFTFNDQWYYRTDGLGPSLVVRDEGQARALWRRAEGWRADVVAGGTPGAAELPLCSDGVDNDGDGEVDLADAGCAGAGQDDESPECDDGVDNDLDGLVDTSDPDCTQASGERESPPPINGFVCFRTRENREGPRFEATAVTLDDAFEGNGPFQARRPKSLCLPAEIDGHTVVAADVALEGYDVRVDSGGPTPVKHDDLLVQTFVGPMFIDTTKPDRLLIPTSVDAGGPATAPVEASHDVDHYKCYRTKQSRGTPKYLPTAAWLHGTTELESKNYRVKPPKRFCTPVGMDGAAVKNPDGYLLCYSARRSKYDLKHDPVEGLHTANALATGLVDTRKEEEICVPAILVSTP
jgi:hypothetical protein